RARAGSNRSPLWRHGGIIFGPQPRDYGYTMPKKKVRGAIRSALSIKLSAGGLVVLDEFPTVDGRTKSLSKILATLGLTTKTLIVAGGDDDKLQGKIQRIGRMSGKKPDWKKAIVTMKAGEKLEMFEGDHTPSKISRFSPGFILTIAFFH